MFSDPDMRVLVVEVSELLLSQRKKLVTAESCTGGLISALVTEQAGSSSIFERGFVTYSNLAKQTLLGVPLSVLETVGAVSSECAEAMARGALAHSPAHIAVSVTGIAGPSGSTSLKPIGLVYIAVATENFCKSREFCFSGSRSEIRAESCREAFRFLIEHLAPVQTA